MAVPNSLNLGTSKEIDLIITWLAGQDSPHGSFTAGAGHGHLEGNLQPCISVVDILLIYMYLQLVPNVT